MPLPFPFTMFGANRASAVTPSPPSDPSCDFTYCFGGSWVQGKVERYALNFVGSGDATTTQDYVDINNYSDISALTDNFTIQSWIKFGDVSASPSNGYHFAVSTLQQLGGSPWLYGFALGRSGGGASHTDARGKISFLIGGSVTWDEAFSNDAGNTGVNTDGAWHHVVGVRDSGIATLYIDGVAQTETITNTPVASAGMVLGRHYYNADSLYFSGTVDEVAVWNAPLTPAQISLLSTGSARADSITPPNASDGSWSTGKVDTYSLDFDGANDYVDLPLGAATGSTSDGTSGSLTCWINPDTISNWPTIFGGGNNAGGNNDFFEYYLETSDLNRLGLGIKRNGVFYGSTVATAGGLSSNGSISTGAWQHIAVVGDGTNFTFYINGTSSSGTGAGWFSSMSTDYLQAHIGALPWSSGIDFEFDGKIDEFAFWDEPLSAQSILDLYNSGSGAKSNSIIPTAAPSQQGDWAAGKVDTYSLEFGGRYESDYVSIPDNSSIQFGDSDDFTVACWVSSSNTTSWYQGFVSKAVGSGGNYAGWLLFRTNDEKMGCRVGSAGDTRGFIYTDSAPDDTWHHLVMTRNGTSKAAALWLDGIEQAGSTTKPLDDSGGNMRLGKWWVDNEEYGLNGKLDEVGIWDVVLDSGAIFDLYNDGTGSKANTVSSSALVDYYDMEDGPGSSTLTDQSSNTNSGTLISMSPGVAPFGTPTLVSYYDMEDGIGTTLTDRTANGYDGTLTGFSDTGTTGSLLLYYDFEIGDSNPVSGNFPTSTTVYDVVTASFHSPTAHTGTMTNMSVADFGAWSQGKIGKYSIDLTGSTNTTSTGDVVEIADNSIIQLENDMTVACWVYGTNQTFIQGIASKADSSGATYHHGWILGRNSSDNDLGIGANYWTFSPRTGASFSWVASNAAGASNTWTHLVGTQRSGVNYLYVDGVQQTDTETLAIQDSGKALRIGQWWFQSAPGSEVWNTDLYPWVGKVDEFSIWSGSLSDANITSLAAGSKANVITASSSDTGDWLPGKEGNYALNMPGGTSYVSASNTGDCSLPSGSMACWAKIDGTGFIQWVGLLGTEYGGGGSNTGDSFGFYRHTFGGGRFYALLGDGDGAYATCWIPASEEPTLTDWNHYAMTWSDDVESIGDLLLYVNGVSVGTFYVSGGPFTPGERFLVENQEVNLGVGHRQTYGAACMNGELDEVGLWNERLSASDIDSLHSGSLCNAISSSNLILYYDFEGGGGSTTIVDRSTAGNDHTGIFKNTWDTGQPAATLAAYLDFECNGPGNSIAKDLSGNDLSGTLKHMKTGSCGDG